MVSFHFPRSCLESRCRLRQRAQRIEPRCHFLRGVCTVNDGSARAGNEVHVMGDQDKAAPRFFSVPPRQEPPDARLTGAAREIHSSVHTALKLLMALPTYPDERDRCAWMWFCCLPHYRGI